MKMPSTEHPEELFLEYLEGALSTEEKMILEEHLTECDDCRAMLDELRQISGALEANQNSVFCPEPWELHELAASGREPADRLAQHLERCPECARELAEYQTLSLDDRIPARVTDSFKALAARQQSAHESREVEGFAAKLLSRVAKLFRVPLLPLASVAAAAILAVVLLYPAGGIEPMLGLSDVPWSASATGPQGTPKSLVAVEKQRVAMLLVFEGFPKSPSRKLIDDMYRELQPPEELYGRFQFVDPPRLKASLRSLKIDPGNHKPLMDRLEQDLKVSMALILSVSTYGNTYRVSGELIDTKTGDSLEQVVLTDVSEADLPAKAQDAAISLLSTQSKSKGSS